MDIYNGKEKENTIDNHQTFFKDNKQKVLICLLIYK